MKKSKTIATAENFSAVNFGKLNEIKDYVLDISPDFRIPGKMFGGTEMGTTGGEFSFQSFAPGTESGFLHTHKTHEELYFCLLGKGEFQVDGQVFAFEEGSAVRVAPAGKRSIRNNGDSEMIVLCVQYKGNTFTADDASDGEILDEKVEW